MPLSENTLLQGGKYKIVSFIASGGFGCTYEAEHTMLQKRVAIKEFFVKDFCNRNETTGEVSVGTTSRETLVTKLKSKFLEEARSLSKLNHPHIVKVTDVFEENGTAYLVMNFIEGETLDAMVKREGALPEYQAVKYILDVCDALEYVHDNNRLHLDVKPANIIIDDHDNAILIDFGASKQYDEVSRENKSTLLGKTPGYAPLEQLGNSVSTFQPATDIYSLGATLYKLLTGITPPSSNLLACGEELSPLPAKTSPAVYNGVMWALESNRSSRPQSIDEFRKVISGDEVAAPVAAGAEEISLAGYLGDSEGGKSRKGMVYAIVAGICLVIAIAVFFALQGGSSGGGSSDTDTTTITGGEVPAKPIRTENMKYVNSKGESFTYTGEVNTEGVPHGKGVGVYKLGTYTGMYENGLRKGEGEYKTKSGKNHFTGTYDDDMYEEGILVLEDKSYYKGSFKNNDFFTGVFYNPDGTIDYSVTEGK